jgi:hypothetical protein
VPKLITEVAGGNQFSRSSNQGQLADSAVRAFRMVLNEPGEAFDIQASCGVYIGDKHPVNDNLFCVSFDGRLEGDSRMVYAVSFQYQSTADAASSSGGGSGADPKSQPPEVRPANWTTSTSLMEMPKRVWAARGSRNVFLDFPVTLAGDPFKDGATWRASEPAINPAGDMYDGVTALEPVVTINITQFERDDPTRHLLFAGHVNSEEINLGSLKMTPGTVLFRGVACQPVVESWGNSLRRGWTATYEFAYRRNRTKVNLLYFDIPFGGGNVASETRARPAEEIDIGWDIAVPVAGFNCRAFPPNVPLDTEDPFGLPLRHKDGKIETPLALPENIDIGDRVRAMVRVFEYENGGASQAPSASPVALNINGRPRKTHDADGKLINEPLVIAYKVQPDINLTQTLALRFF